MNKMNIKHGDIVKVNGVLGEAIEARHEKKGTMLFLPVTQCSYYENQLDEIVNYEVATHEEKLKYLQGKHIFGNVVDWHCIGDYQILKCIRDEKIRYQVYINYEDTYSSYPTLDSAIIGAMSQKYDGCNTRADKYICKMLGIE